MKFSDDINEKYRTETKYLVNEKDFAVIEGRISNICARDSHSKGCVYSIRSLYFDTYGDRFFHENENGTDPREKYRIRIYNGDTDFIRLECKKKLNGKNLKESSVVSREFVERILAGEMSPAEELGEDALINRFVMLAYSEGLTPKVIVGYERTPFVYGPGNVRITFDRKLEGSADVEHFLDGDYFRRPIMATGEGILEVKYDELLPNDIQNMMQLSTLKHTAFSKYYYCRQLLKETR